MDHVFDAYIENVQNHSEISDDDKTKIVKFINLMPKYIGYADQLDTAEGEKFYDDFPDIPEGKFFNFAMALNIFNANRAFTLVKGTDWSKYSKPSTANAFFSSKDNSVQFPAGIIQVCLFALHFKLIFTCVDFLLDFQFSSQDPNFDPRRPGCMNFGALGG